MSDRDSRPDSDWVDLTADIVSAYVSANAIGISDLPKLIGEVHAALKALASNVPVQAAEELRPAVPVRKSVMPDYIVCLEDGKKFKSMRRHLSVLGMTPEQYRQKWNLPSDYPMVASSYSAKRSSLARTIGLGRKPTAGKAH